MAAMSPATSSSRSTCRSACTSYSRVARSLRTGTLSVNTNRSVRYEAPFGGYKKSGIGRELGRFGFEEYLQTKSLQLPA